LLRAILEELRVQRAALQRTYVNAYRAQMLTERLARQQARIDSLTEEITQLKTVAQQLQDYSQDENELKDLLATINETADPIQRASLIQSYNSLKRAIERQREYARQEAERNRERQQQAELALRAEQTKLAELQEQLEALDREFDKQLGEPRKTR
jgi:chromosome segregation ATPase